MPILGIGAFKQQHMMRRGSWVIETIRAVSIDFGLLARLRFRPRVTPEEVHRGRHSTVDALLLAVLVDMGRLRKLISIPTSGMLVDPIKPSPPCTGRRFGSNRSKWELHTFHAKCFYALAPCLRSS